MLITRAEPLVKHEVPTGVRFLVTTVDMQGCQSRFVVQVTGYGVQGERWVIDLFSFRHAPCADEQGEGLPINPAAGLYGRLGVQTHMGILALAVKAGLSTILIIFGGNAAVMALGGGCIC